MHKTHDKLSKELDRMTWARDSEKREIRLLKDKIYGLKEEIERLGRVVDSQNDRYAALMNRDG
jgi:hypothetical protein